MRVAIFTGQVRTPDMFGELLVKLANTRFFDQIFFCTWDRELDAYPDLGSLLRSLAVQIVEVPVIESDTWGNSRRQSLLLQVGLDRVAHDAIVVKLRPDLVISVEHIVCLAEFAGSLPAIAEEPWAGHLGYPIVVPWWSPQGPFRLGDELFAGRAADLALTNRQDVQVAEVCPHMARWSAPWPVLPSWTTYQEGILRPWSGFVASRHPGYRLNRLETVLEPLVRRAPRSNIYRFLADVAGLPSAQIALADFHFLIGKAFRIYNPTPDHDMFIAGKGRPWAALPGFALRSSSLNPAGPAEQLVSYSDDPSSLVNAMRSWPGNRWYRERRMSLDGDPSAVLTCSPGPARRARNMLALRYAAKGLLNVLTHRSAQLVLLARGDRPPRKK